MVQLKSVFVPRILVLASWLACASTSHAQLSLLTEPQGARVNGAAPNIIISVDDSGSMGWPENGVTGIDTLKNALSRTFNDKNLLPDGKIRLAWQSMNLCPGFPSMGRGCGNNGMRSLEGAHRTNFLNWVNSLWATYGTPSFSMFINAGEYLKTTGINSPWANVPGVDGTELSCRKNFHVFLSDGAYGDSTTLFGNADGTSRIGSATGDKKYVPGTSQTRLYTDGFAYRLADVAFNYWATDLRTDLPDNVPPYWADRNGQKGYYQNNNEDFGAPGAPAVLEPYWNPRNNPANWQHMVNYTIGFMSAATWSGNPIWRGESNTGLGPLIRGEASWPNHPYPDHWHAAINSRGRFIPVKNPSDLSKAFDEIFKEITDRGSPSPAGASASNLRLGAPGLAFVTSFNSEDWSGSLVAYPVSKQGVQSATESWDSAKLLDARSSARRLLTSAATSSGNTPVVFDWANLGDSQKALLNGTDNLGSSRVSFVAGNLNANAGFRSRTSRMGSFINSVPHFVGEPGSANSRSPAYLEFVKNHRKRPAMVYAGSSGGMLHAFNAATGQEAMAYVPMGVYPKLHDFTAPSYQHQFMVDGSPFSADADLRANPGNGSANWRTVLVGTMGLGGRGYFALDVTESTGISSAAPDQLVLFDRSAPGTTGTDADIGFIASPPVMDELRDNRSEQIVRLNNQRWAVVLGNGVNSPNQRPVLLIQYLDGQRELKTLVASATTGQGNGLGSPRTVDYDGNGTTDLVYAGDQKGNIWRFDLLASSDTQWAVGIGAQPLFSGVTNQPIMAAPYWVPHPKGGVQIGFGTGRQLTADDRTSTTVHNLYGVRDNFTINRSNNTVSLSGTTRVTSLSQLVKQDASATAQFSTTTRNTVNYTNSSGWYMPLPGQGERLLDNPVGVQGKLLEFATNVPTAKPSASCEISYGSGTTYISYLDIINGSAPTVSLLTKVPTDSRYMANRFQASGMRVTSKGVGERVVITIDPANGSSTGGWRIDPQAKLVQVDWRRLN